MRVPTFVISPQVGRGVSSEIFDHTSILKTIIQRFLHEHPPDMGPRVGAAKSVEVVFPAIVPSTNHQFVELARRPRVTHTPSRLTPDPDDFHAFMGRFRTQLRRR